MREKCPTMIVTGTGSCIPVLDMLYSLRFAVWTWMRPIRGCSRSNCCNETAPAVERARPWTANNATVEVSTRGEDRGFIKFFYGICKLGLCFQGVLCIYDWENATHAIRMHRLRRSLENTFFLVINKHILLLIKLCFVNNASKPRKNLKKLPVAKGAIALTGRNF